MEWVRCEKGAGLPVKSWCAEIEDGAMAQADNLSRHPAVFHHVALMPDCHVGYGMPIGGVIACEDAVIPNAVGVDIGCGMVAVKTNVPMASFEDMAVRRKLLDRLKDLIPVGDGACRKEEVAWSGFERYLDELGAVDAPQWPSRLDRRNLGTLGGGNHFIELQHDEAGLVWLMIHSGSRNLGYRIAGHYHARAEELNRQFHVALPDRELAFLPVDSEDGRHYIRDMRFALAYALENRRIMMAAFKQALAEQIGDVEFADEVNIHHNYAAQEEHFGKKVWVHRKGATSAREGEIGIIPGSMGTPSYIVKGRGNPESFMSCSHGAGRRMGRGEASRQLSVEDCNRAMEGIAFDRWNKFTPKWKKKGANAGLFDLSEAPLAYKDIDVVIAAELDLIEPLVNLRPLGVVKG